MKATGSRVPEGHTWPVTARYHKKRTQTLQWFYSSFSNLLNLGTRGSLTFSLDPLQFNSRSLSLWSYGLLKLKTFARHFSTFKPVSSILTGLDANILSKWNPLEEYADGWMTHIWTEENQGRSAAGKGAGRNWPKYNQFRLQLFGLTRWPDEWFTLVISLKCYNE